jgi:hypothetical protein
VNLLLLKYYLVMFNRYIHYLYFARTYSRWHIRKDEIDLGSVAGNKQIKREVWWGKEGLGGRDRRPEG